MSRPTPAARKMPVTDRDRETKLALGVVGATVVGLLAIAIVGIGDEGSASGVDGGSGVVVMTPVDETGDETGDDGAGAGDLGDDAGIDLVDLVEPEAGPPGEDCRIEASSLRLGDSGADVRCLQQALAEAGNYSGPISGEFDRATFDAASSVQTARDLFVDGVVGRETALSLGIWPDEESFVVRTPPPPPGAVDSLGFPLSSVATTGADAPPLPEGSGSGRRLVYERQGQRVWAVSEGGEIIRSWLVTGSQYNNELPGTHYVYSRSLESTAWNGAARLPKMVRWLETARGHIGFHGIPTRMDNGEPYQTDAELGSRLSGGCQRQADLDADFVWEFAPEGTKVVVL